MDLHPAPWPIQANLGGPVATAASASSATRATRSARREPTTCSCGPPGGPLPALRDSALTDPDDPWNVRHYRDRLGGYYGADAELVGHLLDAYAKADAPLDIDGLLSLLGTVDLDPRPGRDKVLRLVEDLESDHYLERKGPTNQFSSRILRDAWRRMRRL